MSGVRFLPGQLLQELRQLGLKLHQVLGAFVKLWKATAGFVMSACRPSVRPHGTVPLDALSLIFFYVSLFQNPAKKIQILLKSFKSNAYFIDMYYYYYHHHHHRHHHLLYAGYLYSYS